MTLLQLIPGNLYKIINTYTFGITGICYGFQVLQVCESPNVPFTVLLERTEKGTDLD